MPYHPDVHHRHSIRLPDFDYSCAGAYFVTVCTFQRECLFGEIIDGGMRLNEAGVIVQQAWDGLLNHFQHVQLDQFVIMPNHVHGIVVLVDAGVGAGFKPALSNIAPDKRAGLKPAPTPMVKRHGLPEIVRAFKTFSARHINTHRRTPGQPIWQRNYYEHVIRDDRDLTVIREYIADNPAKWVNDENNPGP